MMICQLYVNNFYAWWSARPVHAQTISELTFNFISVVIVDSISALHNVCSTTLFALRVAKDWEYCIAPPLPHIPFQGCSKRQLRETMQAMYKLLYKI